MAKIEKPSTQLIIGNPSSQNHHQLLFKTCINTGHLTHSQFNRARGYIVEIEPIINSPARNKKALATF
jgi:hypothetical protein